MCPLGNSAPRRVIRLYLDGQHGLGRAGASCGESVSDVNPLAPALALGPERYVLAIA